MRGIIRARGNKDGRCMILFPTVIVGVVVINFFCRYGTLKELLMPLVARTR